MIMETTTGSDVNAATELHAPADSDRSVVQYHILYYKVQSSRKVHPTKGVSKRDGILRFDRAASVVSLIDDVTYSTDNVNDDGKNLENQKQNQRPLYTSSLALHPSFAKRVDSLFENDESIQLGGYQIDFVGTSANHLSTREASSQPFTPKNLNIHPNAHPYRLSKRPVLQTLRSKRFLQSIHASIRAHTHQTSRLYPCESPAALPLKYLHSSQPSVLKEDITNESSHSGCSKSNSRDIIALSQELGVPVKIAQVMRPHQVVGVRFLLRALRGTTGINRENVLNSASDDDEMNRQGPSGGGAILADEPGLGKTLTTIACIAALHRKHRHKHFCVVCPSSLVNNWEKEFDQWLGIQGQPKRVSLNCGDASHKNSLMKSFRLSKIGQVVILSYELFRLHHRHFCHLSYQHPTVPTSLSSSSSTNSKKPFALLVVDEGHRLKSGSGSITWDTLEQLPTDRRLLLSATPIQNNLSELFTLANFCRPGVVGNDMTEFRRRFERPILQSRSSSSSSSSSTVSDVGRQAQAPVCSAQRELDQITSKFILRRLQHDILATTIPPRMEVLLFCCPTDVQCHLYQDAIDSVSFYETPSDILTVLTSLRKICSHPLLFEGSSQSNQTSAVVADRMPNRIDKTAASFSSSSGQVDDVVCQSGKLTVLRALLHSMHQRAADAFKVVIVSNFTSTLSLVESRILQPSGFSYVRLDGSTNVRLRQSLVDSFNKQSSVFCFLLSTKAGGCGLNLIGANRLILLDPSWNPADDIQAMGRIYRQGQTRPTVIYRMFTSGTIEEVIYQRQCLKSTLADDVLDAKRSSPNFSCDEINECLTLKRGCDCATQQKDMGKHWPIYRGVTSLHEHHDCIDVPLIEVADRCSDVLKFVRIIPQSEALTSVAESSVEDSSLTVSFFDDAGDDGDDDDAEEEFEFGL